MDLLTAISTCSLHHDITLLLAMALTFSEGSPLMVQDANADPEMAAYVRDEYASEDDDSLTLPMPQAPKTRQAALAAIERVDEKGGAPIIGLLPVPPAWASMFQRKTSELLHACTNVSIASAMLSDFEYTCGAKAGRPCVLEAYAAAIGMPGFDAAVLQEIRDRQLGSGDATVETEAMLDAPVLSAPVEDPNAWGSRSLFFAISEGEQLPMKSGSARPRK